MKAFLSGLLLMLAAGRFVAARPGLAEIPHSYAQLPLAFERLPRQTLAEFCAHGRGYHLFVSSTGDVRITLPGQGNVLLRFEGASSAVSLQPGGQLPGRTNYLIGPASQWRVGVPNYARLRAIGLYNGIDAVYYGSAGEFEYDLTIAPGVDPNLIRLRFSGHRHLSVDSNGDLIIHFKAGLIRQKVPFAYQTVRGIRHRIRTSYEIVGPSSVRLHVAEFERTSPLTIDPVLSYSTYFGTIGADGCYALAIDSEGNAYLAGITDSPQLQTTPGAFQTGFKALTDAFVTKLNATGTAAIFTTYYGGRLNEGANGVGVDGEGNVYIAGTTQSDDLPTTPGAFQTTYRGGHSASDPSIMGDAFVAKFDKTGSRLIYATYLGGTQAEILLGFAVDSSGNAILSGATQSFNFPVSDNAAQSSYHGNTDGFVTKLNPSGSALVFSTFIGGRDRDGPERVVVDADGNIFIAGTTASPDFPTTPGAYQTAAKGGADAFALKFSPQGRLIFSTLLGSSTLDQGRSIAVDAAGNVYLLGQTSAADGFPITTGAAQSRYAGGLTDGFIAKFDPTGSRLVYCTYFGGEGSEDAGAIVVDAAGDAYATVLTSSLVFATTPDALQPKSGGGVDSLIVKLNPAGSAFAYKSFLGGSGTDNVIGLALDRAGNLFLTGTTSSTDFPTVRGSYRSVYIGGATDGFLTKLQFGMPELTTASDSLKFTAVAEAESPGPQTVRIASSADPLPFSLAVPPAAFWLSVNTSASVTPATLTFAVNSRNLSPGNYSANVTVAAAAPSTAKLNIAVALTVAANENPAITAAGAVHAATFLGGPVAPGLIVTLYGNRMGPEQLVGAQLSGDALATTVAGTRVFFDGQAAPLVYVSAGQVSAIVPYAVGSKVATQVQVQYQDRRSNVISLPVAATAPGIFTVASSGSGQGVIFNEDTSLNSPSNPAEKGSIVVLYVTGEGETDPPGVDGKLANGVLPKPLATISLRIGDSAADLIYAGAAPGFTAGLMQINARVPAEVPSGPTPIVLVVGGNSSPTSVTISIK